jgi:hypothetical protein
VWPAVLTAGTLECRILHIKTLEGKAKSCADWLKKAERKLKNARKFYAQLAR